VTVVDRPGNLPTGGSGPVLTCTDAFRRERHLVARVARSGTHVALRVPPGELALLTPAQTRSLSDHLTSLADRVAHPDNQAHLRGSPRPDGE
jgi:hypothetical protein